MLIVRGPVRVPEVTFEVIHLSVPDPTVIEGFVDHDVFASSHVT